MLCHEGQLALALLAWPLQDKTQSVCVVFGVSRASKDTCFQTTWITLPHPVLRFGFHQAGNVRQAQQAIHLAGGLTVLRSQT